MTEPRRDRPLDSETPPFIADERAAESSLNAETAFADEMGMQDSEEAPPTELQVVALGAIIAERDAPLHQVADTAADTDEGEGGWLRALLPGSVGLRAQLVNLNRAVAAAPNAASNYLLRGELLVTMRRYALAQEDFTRARELARADAAESRWGLVGQVVQDRAIAGLAHIQLYLIDE